MACLFPVERDIVVADPVEAGCVVVSDFDSRPPDGLDGLWEVDVPLSVPDAGDQQDDLGRLAAALPHAREGLPVPLLARLPGALRRGRFGCRVFGVDERVLGFEPLTDFVGRRLGMAVDIGTTTLAAALCDLRDGSVLSVASAANPQATHGDDVITRISYASRGSAELREMRALVVGELENLFAAACAEAEVEDSPALAVISANTVMNHLLLGVEPEALAVSPFIPAFRSPIQLNAAELGWHGDFPPHLYVLPNISAYVGGDITAGILAHDLHRCEGTALLLDAGTNGEIALSVRGRLFACSAAAGPAFEGAGIRQGMRAAPGAISAVGLSDAGNLDIGVVGGGSARGICGTGLLDAVAVLLRTGMVDETGGMADEDEAAELHRALRPLLHDDQDGRAIWLERPNGDGKDGVALTQRDIREFQLAKGALAAGCRVLLDVAGVRAGDIDVVYLAGGFGSRLDPGSALAVGLLPDGIRPDRVRAVGNASLAGARLSLLSAAERAAARGIAARVEYVELSGRADFQRAFAEEMLFPEK